jgi:lipopolysaccharide biosynthesis glycosyltransferase
VLPTNSGRYALRSSWFEFVDGGDGEAVEGFRDRVIVYVTDPGYLWPSLVSGEQALRQVSDVSDVVIALTGFTDAEYSVVSGVIDALGLRPLRIPDIELPPETEWKPSYLSRAALGRLVIPDFLDSRYRHVIYIDGDTQIVGDVRPLVTLDVPEGRIAAAPSAAWLHPQRFPEGYIRRLGIEDPLTYFNSGVLALERSTFDKVMPEAMSFFLKNSERCLFYDQSALNAVMNQQRFVLSPRYNFFPTYFAHGVDLDFDPVIVHFVGDSKPWLPNSVPSVRKYYPNYVDIIERFPLLRPYAAPIERSGHAARAEVVPLHRKLYNSPNAKPLRKAVRNVKRRFGAIKTIGGFDLS